MTDSKLCIFCGKPNVTPPKEDVLAQWIARELPKDTIWVASNQETGRTFKTKGGFGLLTRAPCGECNHGWMGQLENKVIPIFRPMFRGTSCILSEHDQVTVSQWLLKTAITHENIKRDGYYFFQPDECKAFMDASTMPDTMLVALGRHIGSQPLYTRELACELSSTQLPLTHELNSIPCYTVTFVIFQLVLQLFVLRRPQRQGVRAKIPVFGNDEEFIDAIVPIWPILGPVQWPPRLHFADSTIESFALRWFFGMTPTN